MSRWKMKLKERITHSALLKKAMTEIRSRSLFFKEHSEQIAYARSLIKMSDFEQKSDEQMSKREIPNPDKYDLKGFDGR